MPRRYVLDTNAIIYYVTDEPRAREKLISIIQDPDVHLVTPAIVIAELWAAPHMPLDHVEHMGAIRAFLGTTAVVPLGETLAQSAGLIQRASRMKVGDACIAATALSYGATLLTRNVKDFRRVSGLSIEAI